MLRHFLTFRFYMIVGSEDDLPEGYESDEFIDWAVNKDP